MSQRWDKHGVLLEPPSTLAWAHTHAALPIADAVDDAGFDLLFSSRDAEGRARIGRARVSTAADELHVAVDPEPLLGLGTTGTFDDRGVTGSCLVREGGRRFLYYSGWSLGVTVPFYFYVGCAVSDDDGASYRRASAAPVLERDGVDPYLTASPWVLVENGIWRMWYVSCTGWTGSGRDARHAYHVKYAESADGIRWQRSGHVCIDYASGSEHAISRPCVVRDGNRYRMWFAARGSAYRLGYAESDDGLTWERDDREAGLEPSDTGWDSEMVCYPCVVERGNQQWMLYNGNGYGATGIGWASQAA